MSLPRGHARGTADLYFSFSRLQASLIRMGFPSHAGRGEGEGGGGGLGMCLCHADTPEAQKISVAGYICPQCQAR